MPRLRAAVLLSLLCIVAANFALAADDDNQYAIKGLGLATCGKLAETQADIELKKAFVAWIDGYLTARNQLSPATFDLASWESSELILRLAIENCAKVPDVRVAQVFDAILRKLADSRLATKSLLVPATRDGNGLMLYAATLIRVTEVLSAQGYFEGSPSAEFNDQISAALSRFQQDKGIPVTGLPDQVTLWKLFRPAR